MRSFVQTLTCSFYKNNSPVCSRIGDKRCVTAEHYLQCNIHPQSFHSKQSDCVKCVAAVRREEKRASRERSRENEQPMPGKREKKPKKPKVKPEHEKTIKQLRREKREVRKSSAGTEESGSNASMNGGGESDDDGL